MGALKFPQKAAQFFFPLAWLRIKAHKRGWIAELSKRLCEITKSVKMTPLNFKLSRLLSFARFLGNLGRLPRAGCGVRMVAHGVRV